MGERDLGLVLSASDSSRRQRPKAEKEGSGGGGELGGGARRPGEWCDEAAVGP
jgi:hypothetical protein